ncbi:penicillin acylase family protein [Streptomyces tsukubensis]|uniref:Penicillin acylase family protein n=1 Tax=Streptomyces tsukubensis (strain DSM 42081 / NBRC 108919 / NRRL 18488 / 9993) TaxID=1114943 RepID=I2MZX5_STRT9|nr:MULTISPECIES: penicillin acylase family protein [Streptomyces]AZK94552.1 penicillin acylase family protein [Streptomyces tsukubensis]EIF90322.1 peptidase S45 penicillin amidase [Streptomyces tsukubensis NRRL18488]MYS68374.1 penicillin acylase family protein [Streptomyces sp. SID5473]QKM69357.1 penicillin acylase family protein [Streptomyces tsukubensis NRRL18488]TAI42709.1 penicillin acylase family protein [Streptomyces tsukubensis]
MPSNTTASSPKKKKGRRGRLLVIVLVLALLGGIGYGGYWGVDAVRASFPQTTGEIDIPGLEGRVEVKRDDYGVPQIYADSDADLFRAQGFVQAQDRFWEMDVRRHMTAGRLSEMFGSGQVKTDAFLRTLGWRKVAQKEFDTELSADTKAYLTAYADGVNAYLKGKEGKELSVEYAALALTNDYKPEPWTEVDSVAWLKAMAWDLRGNMQDEIDRALMESRLDTPQINQLYPAYRHGTNKPIMSNGAVDESEGVFDPKADPSDNKRDGDNNEGSGSQLDSGNGNGNGSGNTESGSDSGQGGTGEGSGLVGNSGPGDGFTGGTDAADAVEGVNTQLAGIAESLDGIPALLGPNGDGIGSNSWVVSGRFTTTGQPLLANDPHLAPQLPSLWYQMGLHCRKLSSTCTFDTAGFTFSGMPGVIIGHNQDIAWGLTNLGADVTDLYLEKVSGDSYVTDTKQDREEKLTVRREVIKVAGGKPRTITVRETKRGPLISDRSTELENVGVKAPVDDEAPDRATGYGVSLQWTALRPGKSMDAVFALNRAKDFRTFRAAAKNFEVPSQNLIYADKTGKIGYQAPGRIPVRATGDGTRPAPGWDPAYYWKKDPVPFEEMPYEEDPERGYIVTANQAVIDESYPHLLTKDWGYGARSQRINQMIEQKIKDGGKISTEDMRTMQMDNRSEIASLLNPILIKLDIKDPNVREAQKLLEGWDYSQEPDSAAAAYFNAVWRNILKLAFGNKLPKELRAEGDCLSIAPAGATGPDDRIEPVIECGERDGDSAQPDGGDRWFEVVQSIYKDEDNPWWTSPASRTDKATKTRDELFARAMEDARWELTAELGKDMDTWNWGRLHQLTLKNQTLGKEGPGLLQHLLNRGPWNLGGGEATVNATGWNAASGYEVVWVPSMRMVVNVGDWDKSRWINLTGASGHAYSAHYTDQTDKWAKGELLDWSFTEKAVEENTVDTLTLVPSEESEAPDSTDSAEAPDSAETTESQQ